MAAQQALEITVDDVAELEPAASAAAEPLLDLSALGFSVDLDNVDEKVLWADLRVLDRGEGLSDDEIAEDRETIARMVSEGRATREQADAFDLVAANVSGRYRELTDLLAALIREHGPDAVQNSLPALVAGDESFGGAFADAVFRVEDEQAPAAAGSQASVAVGPESRPRSHSGRRRRSGSKRRRSRVRRAGDDDPEPDLDGLGAAA